MKSSSWRSFSTGQRSTAVYVPILTRASVYRTTRFEPMHRGSRMRALVVSADQRRRYAPICPEFLVEVISESDRRAVVEAKMEMWIANGAQLAWMIDPFAATLSIYRPHQPVQILVRPDWVEADSVISGFRLETSRLWAK